MKAELKKLIVLFYVLTIGLFSVFPDQSQANEPVDPRLEEIATREAERVARNPEYYNQNKQDITLLRRAGAMTAEMAKFYWAVAAVEFTHCLTSGDSTNCVQFMEGLKDPVGHIGFVLFMTTNKATVDMAMVLSRKRINPGMASYLGLAAGMMAQSVFTDIYYHPTVQELFKTSKIRNKTQRKAKRKELLNKLWTDFTKNSGKYLFDKIPNVVGLLGAAYISHKTMQIAGALFKRSERLVKFAFNKKTATAILKFGRGLYKQRRLAKMGIKYVFKGSKIVRINPVVAIGSYLVETIVFLVWAPIIEEFVTTHWDRGWALKKMSDEKEKLEDALRTGKSETVVKRHARAYNEAWDQFRKSIMNKAEITKARHLMQIQKVDEQFQKLVMYYEWLIRGMDRESDLYTLNEGSWHEDSLISSINEASDYAENFFCGKHPHNAVERKLDVAGLPVPGTYSFDFRYNQNRTHYENMRSNDGLAKPTGIVLSPFKVAHVDGLCEKDLKRMNGGSRPGSYDEITCPLRFKENAYADEKVQWGNHKTYALFCRVYQSQARHHILKTSLHRGENVGDWLYEKLDERAGKAMEKIWSQRDLMIMRYEKAIRYELLTALSGKDVEIERNYVSIRGSVDTTSWLTGNVPLGLMANIDEENGIWREFRGRYPHRDGVFTDIIEENNQKKDMANFIFEYSKKDYSRRTRSMDFFQEVPQTEWEKIVRGYREYIIY